MTVAEFIEKVATIVWGNNTRPVNAGEQLVRIIANALTMKFMGERQSDEVEEIIELANQEYPKQINTILSNADTIGLYAPIRVNDNVTGCVSMKFFKLLIELCK